MSDETNPSFMDLLGPLAPFLAATVLVAVVVTSAVQRYVPQLAPRVSVAVVSFDVIKYTNAQRAVASSFLRPGADVSAPNELLLNLPERTREAIRAVAGPGALVVVKQAVVQGQTVDVTDEVLKRLGLPVNVPTADGTAYSLDVAPTLLFNLPRAETSRTPEPAQQPSGPVRLP